MLWPCLFLHGSGHCVRDCCVYCASVKLGAPEPGVGGTASYSHWILQMRKLRSPEGATTAQRHPAVGESGVEPRSDPSPQAPPQTLLVLAPKLSTKPGGANGLIRGCQGLEISASPTLASSGTRTPAPAKCLPPLPHCSMPSPTPEGPFCSTCVWNFPAHPKSCPRGATLNPGLYHTPLVTSPRVPTTKSGVFTLAHGTLTLNPDSTLLALQPQAGSFTSLSLSLLPLPWSGSSEQ